MSDNAKTTVNLHILEGKVRSLLRSWGPSAQAAGEVGETMPELKIRIETDEYIYEEYVEA